uniref:Heat shock protein 70 n=1 Tax=Rhabditophanes sp. KR3021 TaxID=114890 RepID=A0AC35TLC7_9BILA
MTKITSIGVDFGANFARSAIYNMDGNLDVFEFTTDNTNLNSCVAFTKKQRLIGVFAKKEALENPKNTLTKKCPFMVKPTEDDSEDKIFKINVKFKGEQAIFKPEEIVSIVNDLPP